MARLWNIGPFAFLFCFSLPDTGWAVTLQSKRDGPGFLVTTSVASRPDSDNFAGDIFVSASAGGRFAVATARVRNDCVDSTPGCNSSGSFSAQARNEYTVQASTTEAFLEASGAVGSVNIPLLFDYELRIDWSGVNVPPGFNNTFGGRPKASASINLVGEDFFESIVSGSDKKTGTFAATNTAVIDLRASVSGSLIDRCRGSTSQNPCSFWAIAYADPIVSIDPNWEYAAFADLIEIDERLAPIIQSATVVPVPLSLPLMGTAFALYWAVGRRRPVEQPSSLDT